MKPGLWKDSIVLAFVLLLVLLFLREFHRYAVLGKGLSFDGYALVGMTLVAAALGFGAIMLQLRDQRRTADEDRAREARSLATAVTFEMDDIYRFFIRDVGDFLESDKEDPTVAGELLAKRIHNGPFPLYAAIAGRLGMLEPPLVGAVVHFYACVAAHLLTLEKISVTAERMSVVPFSDVPNLTRGMAIQAEQQVLLEQCRETIPHLQTLSREVFLRLQAFTGIPVEQLAALSADRSGDAKAQ
jgi:hypothetical protein